MSQSQFPIMNDFPPKMTLAGSSKELKGGLVGAVGYELFMLHECARYALGQGEGTIRRLFAGSLLWPRRMQKSERLKGIVQNPLAAVSALRSARFTPKIMKQQTADDALDFHGTFIFFGRGTESTREERFLASCLKRGPGTFAVCAVGNLPLWLNDS